MELNTEHYTIRFDRSDDGGFTIYAVKVKGAILQGANIKEKFDMAFDEARKILKCHIEQSEQSLETLGGKS